MAGIIVIFCLKQQKCFITYVSDQGTHQLLKSKHCSCDLIINLGSNKYGSKNNSTCQMNNLHNSLLMSIIFTPEKYLSNVD